MSNEKVGKCLTCGATMPWGTKVCPQCGLQLVWPAQGAAEKFLRAGDAMGRAGQALTGTGKAITAAFFWSVVVVVILFIGWLLLSIIHS